MIGNSIYIHFFQSSMHQRVRAVIEKDGKILLIKRVKPDETYWVFPGGGVEAGENLENALTREVFEETGLQIQVGALIYSRFFKFAGDGNEQEEFYFQCRETGGSFGTGDGPEFHAGHYVGTHTPEYISLGEISNMPVRPEEMKAIIAA
jgi:ADP-ribose pyrophosphatase YjhB (NUDIX family)